MTTQNGQPAPEPTIANLMAMIEALQRQLHDPYAVKTVAEIVNAYRTDTLPKLSERSQESANRDLERFLADFGQRRAMECSPFELKQWIVTTFPGSGWTRQRANATIQRPFNYAVDMRLMSENPFRGLSFADDDKPNGRDMNPTNCACSYGPQIPTFGALLIMLKLTGARPGELSHLRWPDIDWQRGIATLAKHKTSKKTKRPRVIVFPPSAMKLLAWIKRNRHGSVALELFLMLAAAPNREVPVKQIVARLKPMGYSYRAIYKARQVIGVKYKRIGGYAASGFWVYWLPELPDVAKLPDMDHVFLSSKFRPWTHRALGIKFMRLRALLGLPMSCRLYGLRHFFYFRGRPPRNEPQGPGHAGRHASTTMIDRTYCHIQDDVDFLRNCAMQATGLGQAVHVPVEEPVSTHDLAGTDSPAYRKRRARYKPQPVRKLRECQRVCYEAAKWAHEQEPALQMAGDAEVYAWLRCRLEYHGQLPPTVVTFCRYLRYARQFIDRASKRQQRRNGQQQPPPPSSN